MNPNWLEKERRIFQRSRVVLEGLLKPRNPPDKNPLSSVKQTVENLIESLKFIKSNLENKLNNSKTSPEEKVITYYKLLMNDLLMLETLYVRQILLLNGDEIFKNEDIKKAAIDEFEKYQKMIFEKANRIDTVTRSLFVNHSAIALSIASDTFEPYKTSKAIAFVDMNSFLQSVISSHENKEIFNKMSIIVKKIAGDESQIYKDVRDICNNFMKNAGKQKYIANEKENSQQRDLNIKKADELEQYKKTLLQKAELLNHKLNPENNINKDEQANIDRELKLVIRANQLIDETMKSLRSPRSVPDLIPPTEGQRLSGPRKGS